MTDVSVLTPSLGYGLYIRDALLSVHGQSGVSIEHIVQDAVSSDDTLKILKEFGSSVSWISEPDSGQADALNKALSRASGKWIAWLNADEFYLPHSLAALVEHAERTGADVAYSDCVFVDESGRLERLLPQHPFSSRILREYGCFIPSSTSIFRRSVLGERPWDPGLEVIMDWDLFLRLQSEGARFSWLNRPSGAFRRHGRRVTARPRSAFGDEYKRVFSRYRLDTKAFRRGPWWHGLYKFASGSYFRQWLARSLRGYDLRWFDSPEGYATFRRLMKGAYWRADSHRTQLL